MSRSVVLAGVTLLLLFAAITLFKMQRDGGASPATADRAASADREAITAFWRHYRTATEHRIAGRTTQAIAAYERALELNARHEDALYYAGNMYLEMGRTGAASTAWRQLIAINPQSARAHSRLGDIHFCFPGDSLFDLAAAETEIGRALQINQEETGPLLQLGQIALVRGDHAGARSWFEQVIGSNYRSVDAHFLLGYIAWKGGDRERAAEWFAAAAELAQPAEAIEGVPGEGDTKAGSAPVSVEFSCSTVPVPTADLAARGASEAADMRRYYRQLDARVMEARGGR
jgi:tetratricopeptide (TPR) repeat protein